MKQRRNVCLKEIIRIMRIVMILLTVFGIFVGLVSLYILSSNQKTQIMSWTRFFSNIVENDLSSIDATMRSEILYNAALSDYPNDSSDIERLNYEKELRSRIFSWTEQYGFSAYFWVYFPNSDKMICSEKFYGNQDDEKKRVQNLREILFCPDDVLFVKGKWNIILFDDKGYFVKYYHYEDCYLGCYVDIESMISYFDAYDSNDYQICFLSETEAVCGSVATDVAVLNQYVSDTPAVHFTLQGLLFHARIREGNFSIFLQEKIGENNKNVLWLFLVWTVICFVISICGIYLLKYVNVYIAHPIYQFVDDIRSLRKDISYKMKNVNNITELQYAGEQLTKLADNLEQLRIRSYEKELTFQKIQIDYNTLISKPHFYINCLNTIYMMAELKQYKDIQDLSQSISEYVRYLFYSCDERIPIEKELRCVNSYLSILKRKYGSNLYCDDMIEEELKDTRIPPCCILPFVENSIKHAMDAEKGLEIRISVWSMYMGQDRYIHIRVSDNGKGFDREVLDRLRQKECITAGNKHIGITNVMQRLELIYGDKAEILFFNCEAGGACVEILIPFVRKGAEDEFISS